MGYRRQGVENEKDALAVCGGQMFLFVRDEQFFSFGNVGCCANE